MEAYTYTYDLRLSVMEAWTVLLVDSEYERCRNTNGRFRRLIPSSRTEHLLGYLSAERTRNHLPFDLSAAPGGDDEEEKPDPVQVWSTTRPTLGLACLGLA